ncbi:MAG: AAA family ATPase [Candidatus Micrarchaeaceae archaeon]
MAKKHIVLMVVGLPGSGKSITAKMLERRDFEVIELGDIWRELLKKNNISRFDPIATREFTRKIRQKFGKDIYAKYAFRKIQKKRKKVAIMGVRSTYEMDYLRKRIKHISIIALLAPMSVRFGRLKARGKPEDPKDLKGFKWLETREKRGFMKARSEEKHGIMHIIKEADFVIANTSTLANLDHNLTKLLKEIEKKNLKR